MMSIKLYVWRGERVLKNYSSGLAVVAATSVEEAWDKLKQADFNAWATMKLGLRCVYDEGDLEFKDEAWYSEIYEVDEECKVEPEAFAPEDLPSLVKHGGE
jgi:hypothetical protein